MPFYVSLIMWYIWKAQENQCLIINLRFICDIYINKILKLYVPDTLLSPMFIISRGLTYPVSRCGRESSRRCTYSPMLIKVVRSKPGFEFMFSSSNQVWNYLHSMILLISSSLFLRAFKEWIVVLLLVFEIQPQIKSIHQLYTYAVILIYCVHHKTF